MANHVFAFTMRDETHTTDDMQKYMATGLMASGALFYMLMFVEQSSNSGKLWQALFGLAFLCLGLRLILNGFQSIWKMDALLVFYNIAVAVVIANNTPMMAIAPMFLGGAVYSAYFFRYPRVIAHYLFTMLCLVSSIYLSSVVFEVQLLVGITAAFMVTVTTAAVYFISQRIQDLTASLKQIAQHDLLTNVYNRAIFEVLHEEHHSQCGRKDSKYSLALFDLDHFKNINDTYGHKAGDAALIDFVQIVQKHLRNEDVFARHGGEEFILLMPETGTDQATEICEKIRLSVAEETARRYPFTVSVGIVTPTSHKIEYVMKSVDHALYDAKNSGRNRTQTLRLLPSAM